MVTCRAGFPVQSRWTWTRCAPPARPLTETVIDPGPNETDRARAGACEAAGGGVAAEVGAVAGVGAGFSRVEGVEGGAGGGVVAKLGLVD